MFKRTFTALAAVALAAPAIAAPAPRIVSITRVPDSVVVPGKPDAPAARRHDQPNPAALEAFMAKLFPPLPDPDPARLALSSQSVALMWPDGSYEKAMSGMMDGMLANIMKLRLSDVRAIGPNASKAAAPASDLSLHDAAAAKDPDFDKRMAAIHDVVHEQMRDVSVIVDPRMREGLARTMARRFDAAQLRDINSFFATPSGRAFAAQSMQMWMDPETFRAMMSSLPAMIKLMPAMSQRFQAATANLPKPASAAPGTRH